MTYCKIIVDNPKSDFELVLALSVKEMNDFDGPDVLVPSALIFGEFPKLGMPAKY